MTTVEPAPSFFQRWRWVIAGLIISLAVVLILAPAASSDPDGLDRVSEDKEFAETAKEPTYEWLPDYSIPGIDDEWASVVLAGAVGVAIVFALSLGFGVMLRQTSKRSTA